MGLISKETTEAYDKASQAFIQYLWRSHTISPDESRLLRRVSMTQTIKDWLEETDTNLSPSTILERLHKQGYLHRRISRGPRGSDYEIRGRDNPRKKEEPVATRTARAATSKKAKVKFIDDEESIADVARRRLNRYTIDLKETEERLRHLQRAISRLERIIQVVEEEDVDTG